MRKIIILLSLTLVLSFVLSSCSGVDSPEIADSVAVGEDVSADTQDSVEEVEAANEVEETVEEELEIVDDELDVPEEEIEVDEVVEEIVEEVVEEVELEVEETTEVESSNSGTTYTVEFVDTGFDPVELTISAGDTVVWENARTGNFLQAMLIGTRSYTNIKSGLLDFGEIYSHTFDEAGEYIFVDGILTTYVNTITVE